MTHSAPAARAPATFVRTTLADAAELMGRAVTEYVFAVQFEAQVTLATPSAPVIANELVSGARVDFTAPGSGASCTGEGRRSASRTVAAIIVPVDIALIVAPGHYAEPDRPDPQVVAVSEEEGAFRVDCNAVALFERENARGPYRVEGNRVYLTAKMPADGGRFEDQTYLFTA